MGLFAWFRRKLHASSPELTLKEIWQGFQQVLAAHNDILGVLGDLEEKLSSPEGLSLPVIRAAVAGLDEPLVRLVAALQSMSGGKWPELENSRIRIQEEIQVRLHRACTPPVAGSAPLQEVMDLILPLTLMDRRSPKFRPENCRTCQDIARFAREKAMQVMFDLMDRVAQGQVPALRLLKLKTDLPLNLHLVDLGDGLASHVTPVPPEDILSVPMLALWRGISHPDITWAGPVPVNFGGFLHVLGQSAIRPPEKFWDKTYAIVAAHYVNYACRLGYHFQSVDSYCAPGAANNYINFTFKGGAADDLRRVRRIKLIATVLERLGFEMEIHHDVIRGRFRRHPAPETEERLDLVGRLMAYVRQMDMLMSDDDIPLTLAERFLSGHYERPGAQEGG